MTNPSKTPDRNQNGGGGEHLDDAFQPSSMFEFAESETTAMEPKMQQLTNTNKPGQFEPVGYRRTAQRPFDYGAASKQLAPPTTLQQTQEPMFVTPREVLHNSPPPRRVTYMPRLGEDQDSEMQRQARGVEDEDADADHESITEEEWRAHEFQDQMADAEQVAAEPQQEQQEQIEENQPEVPDADSSGTHAMPVKLSDDEEHEQDDSDLSDEDDSADEPTPAPPTQPPSSMKRPRSPAPALGGTYTYKGATYVIQGDEPEEWLRGESTGSKRQKTSVAGAKKAPVPAKGGVAYKKKKANKEEAELEDDGDAESDEDFDPDAMDLDD
ncbi:unnamed protein product [Zymoseptoria tritici ST99CH_3D7]|uniref:Uncharacterized protein n=1 Tax=Zymoseptoria tritici (strain ST99CH_3D7) TaxID=1276538 RepID=A0A1X7RZS8_ZYMT9|nr:unnamed protein product [Zymoseptoria tritici ST99CH_3D7]